MLDYVLRTCYSINIMRSFFSVVITYIILCVVGTYICASLFMVYIGCLNFVVGQPLKIFSLEALRIGLEISLPLLIMFIPMFLILSSIRHSKRNRVIVIITTIVLSCISWFVGIPAFFKFSKTDLSIKVIEEQKLSSGYFRISGDQIYYFTNVTNSNKVNGIIINTNSSGIDNREFRIIHNEEIEIPGSEKFTDILVKRSVEIPSSLKRVNSDLIYLSNGAYNSYSNSLLSWCFFSLFGLALVFVFTLTRCSRWRLINAFFVLVTTCFVIKINAICYGIVEYKKYFPFLQNLNQKLKSANWLFSQMESPIAVFANLIIILVLTIIGIISIIVNHSRESEA